ncbi:MAG: GrpB family protein [Streptococcus orisratti]|uniref:GrpB family protein n=1 Tax=Streptococcus orisratti TaxID=114652 RepID=UPI0023568D78|nr:GrpB family protein [Streptococcus orisratti]MCI7678102.1 GrpB family protein [Streptococcus orisratti]MDY5635017.1 GrpB family protein [Streptococcus orisratti]
MRTKEVIVLPYQESWKDDFEKIAQELRTVLGELAIRIEHVGSTAVEGLAAKPIIDIDLVILSKDFPSVVESLATIGYQHEGNLGIEGREAFTYSGKEHLQSHHLYVCPENSPELKRHLAFRDYMRSHPAAVKTYGAIKLKAAQLFPKDIESYMAYKSSVIEEIYKELEK